MPYAIIRHAKIKTLGNLAASAQHTFRERETPNADPKLTPNGPELPLRSAAAAAPAAPAAAAPTRPAAR